MCGLAGKMIARREGVVPASLVKAMCDRLAHRGPDGDGYYVNGAIGLGHRRLAVIDLPGGRQPIANEDDTVRVVFNGEIYNYKPLRADLISRGHRFRTESDTEVIVHLYEEHGEAFVDRLHGMFAIALWDERSRVLLLAREGAISLDDPVSKYVPDVPAVDEDATVAQFLNHTSGIGNFIHAMTVLPHPWPRMSYEDLMALARMHGRQFRARGLSGRSGRRAGRGARRAGRCA
jgi:asparagine synthase (glutamine-hydrolysing)